MGRSTGGGVGEGGARLERFSFGSRPVRRKKKHTGKQEKGNEDDDIINNGRRKKKKKRRMLFFFPLGSACFVAFLVFSLSLSLSLGSSCVINMDWKAVE